MKDALTANFGGLVLSAAIVLVEYSAVAAFYPSLATPLLMITALGIVIFWYRKMTYSGPKHQ